MTNPTPSPPHTAHTPLDTILINATKNKKGLEIGGPSPTGQLIYVNAQNLDNVIFSRTTVWSQHKTDKYEPLKGKCGRVYINEATEIHLPNETYDFVFASHTLEHLANPLKALYDWLRVLKKNGSLILIVPEKSACFDHRRQVSKMTTLVEQYHRKVGEDDLSTLAEILRNHDLDMDKPAGSFEQFTKRSLNNYENRCLHHYVYSPDLLREICQYLHCEFVYTITNGLNMWFIMRKI
jgi:SAM-dependent methyltransferase